MKLENLTKEQEEYVQKHLRNRDKSYSIAAIAKMITVNNPDMHIDPDEVQLAAILMNIGETSDAMKINGENIYDHKGAWTQEMRALNEKRGKISVDMAESQGIHLSDSIKEAIISTSRGGSLNITGIALKMAQTMEAVKYERDTKEGHKKPVENISELTEILDRELDFMLRGQEVSGDVKKQIKDSMIAAARKTYVMEKSQKIKGTIIHIAGVTDIEVSANPSVQEHVGENIFTTEAIDKFLSSIPPERIDDLQKEIEGLFLVGYPTDLLMEDGLADIIRAWSEGKSKGEETPFI